MRDDRDIVRAWERLDDGEIAAPHWLIETRTPWPCFPQRLGEAQTEGLIWQDAVTDNRSAEIGFRVQAVELFGYSRRERFILLFRDR